MRALIGTSRWARSLIKQADPDVVEEWSGEGPSIFGRAVRTLHRCADKSKDDERDTSHLEKRQRFIEQNKAQPRGNHRFGVGQQRCPHRSDHRHRHENTMMPKAKDTAAPTKPSHPTPVSGSANSPLETLSTVSSRPATDVM